MISINTNITFTHLEYLALILINLIGYLGDSSQELEIDRVIQTQPIEQATDNGDVSPDTQGVEPDELIMIRVIFELLGILSLCIGGLVGIFGPGFRTALQFVLIAVICFITSSLAPFIFG